MPVAFSIIKDTARRFAENEEVVVTANDFDRELAIRKDFVRIEGDKAIYSNHWMAGGNDMKWDMVHYDVQLLVVSYCIRERLRKWQQVKEKHSLQHYLYS